MEGWLDQISLDQFAMWEAYYVLEPWGEDRADLRAGTIAAMIFNTNIVSGTKPARPEDFLIVRPEDFDSIDKVGKKKAPMSADSWASFKSQMAKSAGKTATPPKKWMSKRGRKKEAQPESPTPTPDANASAIAPVMEPSIP